MADRLFGCIEAGGTKFVAGIASGPTAIIEMARFPTTTPKETIGATISWLAQASVRHGALSGVGIASFGPVELDRSVATWGSIGASPKPGWSHSPFASSVGEALSIPVGFDTDVNGAAIAEARWGAGQGQKISVYVTIGTGIGAGAIVNGVPLQGLTHPEMGHVRPPRHPDDTAFAGVCPFHGDCLEGLASGPAIVARWGQSLSDLPANHPGHAIIAWYLAHFANTLQSIMEPGRIILGGGVMQTPGLLEATRAEAHRIGAAYYRGNAEDVLVRPALGDKAGLLGGLALAMDAFALA
jgi:fructokinase